MLMLSRSFQSCFTRCHAGQIQGKSDPTLLQLTLYTSVCQSRFGRCHPGPFCCCKCWPSAGRTFCQIKPYYSNPRTCEIPVFQTSVHPLPEITPGQPGLAHCVLPRTEQGPAGWQPTAGQLPAKQKFTTTFGQLLFQLQLPINGFSCSMPPSPLPLLPGSERRDQLRQKRFVGHFSMSRSRHAVPTSAQDGIIALEKKPTCAPHPSLTSVPQVTHETTRVLICL